MKKREFIKKAGLGSLALANASLLNMGYFTKNKKESMSLATGKTAQPSVKNWAWIKPPGNWSMDDWKAKLEQAKASGFDALVMNVYDGKVAYFENDRLPVKEALAEKVIPLCKEAGLEFHAWMFTMPCNIEKIVQQHPDWYAVNGLGESAATKPAYVDYYKFLCPCHPEAQEFVKNNVISMAEIPGINGVHFDYVRLPDVILAEGLQPQYNIVQDKEYPQYDYCYSEFCRNMFKEQTGIDPLKDLEDPAANQEWRQFRYNSISNLVNNKLVPEVKNRDKMVTAAVFPNWESVRQEWHRWDLDAFLPMLYHNFYNAGLDFIRDHTQKAIQRLETAGNKKPVYSGIFLPALKPGEIATASQMAHEGGAGGIALFSLELASDKEMQQFASLAGN